MAETLILHSDLNCYYASVEMNEHPNLRGKQVAVCGSTENRHGIVLTASPAAAVRIRDHLSGQPDGSDAGGTGPVRNGADAEPDVPVNYQGQL